jgi:hypothetical protein
MDTFQGLEAQGKIYEAKYKGFWGTNGGKLAWVFSLGLIALIITNVAFQYAKNQRSFA